MSMFSITGQVINTFYQEGRIDKETGEKGGNTPKVQVLGEIPVATGGTRVDLVTLTVPQGLDFKDLKGKNVKIPLGFFAPAKNSIIYYIPKGSKIETLAA